ncbi:MAG: pilus assembly protein PilM [Patescibacteria group bacterium]|nr:pilus assembly protein PilM [Patescibacteria group bacterium]
MAARTFFGLDVGKTSIKIVQLIPEGKGKKLFAYGLLPSPLGDLASGSDTDIATYAQVIKKLLKDLKITSNLVNISLPESKIFTRVIEMPVISDEELESALKWEAEQYIPVPLEEVNMDWQVLERPKEQSPDAKMSVLIGAAPKTIIQKYIKLTENSGLTPLSFEPETIALSRSLITGQQKMLTTIILDMGSDETNLIITKNGLLAFTRTISTGGNAITRAIATNFGLEFVQAEEYKKTYGIEKEHFDGKLTEVIKPLLNVLSSEVQRAVAFYQSKHSNDQVHRLILSGSTALLPGIVRFFTQTLGLETQIADPWQDIVKDAKLNTQEGGSTYAVACGLALKDM